MTNLEPSLQTRTSRNVTVTSDNSSTFIDHVVFASSHDAPYAVFRELSVPGHDDDVVCEFAIHVNGERAHDFRQEAPGFDKLCKRSIGEVTRILFEFFLTRQSLSGSLLVVTN